MVNRLYDTGRQAFLEGQLAWLTHNFKSVLLDTGAYIGNFATNRYLSDIPSGARISTSANLANKTSDAGVADADDVTFPNVTGPTCEAVAIYRDTGDPATSQLVAYIDTASGLPVQPNGGPIAVTWDNGANRIFKL